MKPTNTTILAQDHTNYDTSSEYPNRGHWQRSTFLEPCPVCGDTKGHCLAGERDKHTGFQVALCSTYIDEESAKAYTTKEYVYKKKSKDENYGVFHRDGGFAHWCDTRTFTAQTIINQQWFKGPSEPKDNTIYGFKSPMGSGKSTYLAELSRTLQSQGLPLIALGSRNSLMWQIAALCNLYHIYDHDGEKLIKQGDDSLSLALCFDSILKVPLEYFRGKVIILDEATSTTDHSLFSNTIEKGKREAALDHFKKALQVCKFVICLDGGLTNLEMNYLSELAPEKEIVTIDNQWEIERAPLTFYNGSIDPLDSKLRKSDCDDLKGWMVNFARENPIIIGCDSQTGCESIEKMLNDAGITGGWRIDSKTTPNKETKALLTNIDKAIEEQQPAYILYTSSAESGIDISIKNYFSHHFLLFWGILGVNSSLQMVARVRDIACQKIVWCPEVVPFSGDKDCYNWREDVTAQVRKQVQMNNADAILAGQTFRDLYLEELDRVFAQSDNAHTRHADILLAVRTYERLNFRKCFKYALEEAGYEISEAYGRRNKPMKEVYKKANKEVKLDRATDVFNAQVDDTTLIKKTFDASYEERCKQEKARIMSLLPGIEETKLWSIDFIHHVLFDNPNAIKQVQNYYLLTHPEVGKKLDLKKYNHAIAMNRAYDQAAVWNLKTFYQRIKSFREMGLVDLIHKRDEYYHQDSPAIVDFHDKGVEHQDVLELYPDKKRTRYVGKVLRLFGFDWHPNKSKRRINGEQVWHYHVDTTNFVEGEIFQTMLQCIDRRWNQFDETTIETLVKEVVPAPNSTPETQVATEFAQTYIEQGLEGEANVPIIINTNTASSASPENSSVEDEIFIEPDNLNKLSTLPHEINPKLDNPAQPENIGCSGLNSHTEDAILSTRSNESNPNGAIDRNGFNGQTDNLMPSTPLDKLSTQAEGDNKGRWMEKIDLIKDLDPTDTNYSRIVCQALLDVTSYEDLEAFVGGAGLGRDELNAAAKVLPKERRDLIRGWVRQLVRLDRPLFPADSKIGSIALLIQSIETIEQVGLLRRFSTEVLNQALAGLSHNARMRYQILSEGFGRWQRGEATLIYD